MKKIAFLKKARKKTFKALRNSSHKVSADSTNSAQITCRAFYLVLIQNNSGAPFKRACLKTVKIYCDSQLKCFYSFANKNCAFYTVRSLIDSKMATFRSSKS